MFKLIHSTKNGKENVYSFSTEEEIDAKLREIDNSYEHAIWRYYHKDGGYDINISTNPLDMNISIVSAYQAWKNAQQ